MSNSEYAIEEKQLVVQNLEEEVLSLEAIRLPQDYLVTPISKGVIVRVSVGKPGRQEFFTAHPSEDYQAALCLLKMRDSGDTFYVVSPALAPELELEVSHYRVLTYATRGGKVGLWPIPLPGPDGRENPWHASAFAAADIAMKGNWVRLIANMQIGSYECVQALNASAEPEWPEESFEDLLRIAFRDRFITSLDHEVLKKLRGEE
jgi:hypothetical protein